MATTIAMATIMNGVLITHAATSHHLSLIGNTVPVVRIIGLGVENEHGELPIVRGVNEPVAPGTLLIWAEFIDRRVDKSLGLHRLSFGRHHSLGMSRLYSGIPHGGL
jgi:hypothetical protein